MKILTNTTKTFLPPLICVERKRINEITVTEIASTARNPVFTPNIVNIIDAISPELVISKIFDSSIFSGDANRGTLRTALIKNKKNSPADTNFAWF